MIIEKISLSRWPYGVRVEPRVNRRRADGWSLPPDPDRLILLLIVIANEARQSSIPHPKLDCRVATLLATTIQAKVIKHYPPNPGLFLTTEQSDI